MRQPPAPWGQEGSAPRAVTAGTRLLRGAACRCPACGRGRVFASGVRTARACSWCGWRFERCVGHWVGGNEVNVLVTFPAGVASFVALSLALGTSGALPSVLAAAFTGFFGVAFYRPSRGIFYAIDYLVDPTPDDASPPGPPRDGRGGGGGDRRCAAIPLAPCAGPVSVGPPPVRVQASVCVLAAAPETFPAPPAPTYPPPVHVPVSP